MHRAPGGSGRRSTSTVTRWGSSKSVFMLATTRIALVPSGDRAIRLLLWVAQIGMAERENTPRLSCAVTGATDNKIAMTIALLLMSTDIIRLTALLLTLDARNSHC